MINNSSGTKLVLSTNPINQIKFPILFIDFEAYHLLKNCITHDYFPQINDKPFLLGYTIISNQQQLLAVVKEQKIDYHHYLCWRINHKNGNIFKKFARAINNVVDNYQVNSCVILGAKLELEVINLMHQLNFLTKKSANLKFYDIYHYFSAMKKGENTNSDEITSVLVQNYSLVTNQPSFDKKEWNLIWRKLDNIYSYSINKNLKNFQQQYSEIILQKNYQDLLKLIILFNKKYRIYDK